MGKIGFIPSVVPSIPISMVSGLADALANAGGTTVTTVVASMTGNIDLDFSSKTPKYIQATQTGIINFSSTGNLILSEVTLEITASTQAINFDALQFEEFAGSRAIVPSKKNYIYFVRQATKVGYAISQNKIDALSEAPAVVTDPILDIPNLATYVNPFDLDSVDVNAFSIADQSTYGSRKYEQATVGLRPTLSSKRLVFGDNTRYLRPNSSIPFSNKNFSVTFVAEGSWNGDKMILGYEATINTALRIWYRTGTIQLTHGSAQTYIWTTGIPASTDLKVISFLGYDDAGTQKIKLRINGVEHATIITNVWGAINISGGSLIGNDLNATGKGYVGAMGGIAIINGTPSNTNLLLIENQFKTENGIVY
jgi:hypothetical protein